jgi:hypothetical protein
MGSPVNACDDMVTHWRPCQNPAKRFGSGAAEISVSAAPSRSVGKLVQGILGAHQHCPSWVPQWSVHWKIAKNHFWIFDGILMEYEWEIHGTNKIHQISR